MADQTIGVINQTGAGTLPVDVSELTVNSVTVERQRIVLADPTSATGLVGVSASNNLNVAVQETGFAQGDTSTSKTGILALAAVTDNPSSPTDGTLQALTLNAEGRLRVAIAQGTILWFSDDYGQDVQQHYTSEIAYV